MKVNINIPRAVGRGEFSKIKLGYENSENNNISVSLNIDYINLCMFTNQRGGLAFDIFLIGCYVYGIDILLPRKDFSTNGWSREWIISFAKREIASLYTFKPRAKVYTDSYRKSFNKVSLFSGGLDSLVGIIDHL